METVFIEATNTRSGGVNWGKFLIGRFTPEEWSRSSTVTDDYRRSTGSISLAQEIGRPLLGQIGWSSYHITVMDLQTGEGAIFRPGGLASADLNKHRIHVCVLFEDFLTWLYHQDLSDLQALPRVVNLDTESALYGYRRKGPGTRGKQDSGSQPAPQPAPEPVGPGVDGRTRV